jgi:hypothetical protein
MALTTCRECGKQLSDQASACPHCGAPAAKAIPAPPLMKKHFSVGWLVLWLLIAFVVFSCSRAINGDDSEASLPVSTSTATPAPERPSEAERASWVKAVDDESLLASIRLDRANQLVTHFPSEPETTTAKAKIPALEALVIEESVKAVEDESLPASARLDHVNHLATQFPTAPQTATAKAKIPELQALIADEKSWGDWSYTTTTDDMSGKRTNVASVQSNNTVSFDFPYQGAQHGQLMLRKHPRHGRDVVLSIEKGQLLCMSYDGCRVLVRFDDGPPQKWGASGASDGSTTSVFLDNYDRFVRQMQKAKLVRIAAEVHQEGAPVFEFNVHGFQQARYTP